LDCVHNN
jgi:hypothetical protein